MFKAYLVAKGFSDQDLRRLGHSLVKNMNSAIDNGFEAIIIISQNEKNMIEVIDPFHEARAFVYVSTGYRELPLAGDLLAMNKRLLLAIHDTCIESFQKNLGPTS
jgi:hypothetical protein